MIDSFENQILSEYYGDNRSLSIEGVKLEQYKQVQQTQIGCEEGKPTRHDVFKSCLSDDSNQLSVTITSHIKHPIELLNILKTADLSAMWENIYGCVRK